MHRLMNYIRLDLVHGVTFGNTSLVSLYTSSIFVYAKVLAQNLNVNKKGESAIGHKRLSRA